MKVWTFWTGDEPQRIKTCLKTIERQCSDWSHLTLSDAEKFLGERVHPVWRKLLPAHQADVLRACVLSQHGGLWLDADTVMFKEPENYFEKIKEFSYTTWTNKPRRVLNGYVYSPVPKHPVANRWFANVTRSLFEMRKWAQANINGLQRSNWTRFGEKCLTPAIDETCREFPRQVLLPLDVDRDSPLFFSDRNWQDFVKPETVGFGLSNSYIEKRKDRLTDSCLVQQLLAFAESNLV